MLSVRPGSAQLKDSNVMSRRHNSRPAGDDANGLLAADVAHLDLRQRGRLGRAQLRVTIATNSPDGCDRLVELLVGRTAADDCAQVVSARREQAREQPPLGRQARARAAAAERLRD